AVYEMLLTYMFIQVPCLRRDEGPRPGRAFGKRSGKKTRDRLDPRSRKSLKTLKHWPGAQKLRIHPECGGFRRGPPGVRDAVRAALRKNPGAHPPAGRNRAGPRRDWVFLPARAPAPHFFIQTRR